MGGLVHPARRCHPQCRIPMSVSGRSARSMSPLRTMAVRHAVVRAIHQHDAGFRRASQRPHKGVERVPPRRRHSHHRSSWLWCCNRELARRVAVTGCSARWRAKWAACARQQRGARIDRWRQHFSCREQCIRISGCLAALKGVGDQADVEPRQGLSLRNATGVVVRGASASMLCHPSAQALAPPRSSVRGQPKLKVANGAPRR